MDNDKIVDKIAKTFKITADDKDFTISAPKIVKNKRGKGGRIQFVIRATVRFIADYNDDYEDYYKQEDGTPDWEKIQYQADEAWLGAIDRCDKALKKYKWSADVWSFHGTNKRGIYTGFATFDYEFGIADALETLEDSYR